MLEENNAGKNCLGKLAESQIYYEKSRVHLVKVMPKIFGVGFKFCGVPACDRQDIGVLKRVIKAIAIVYIAATK